MSGQPKIRFSVVKHGVEKELFSVQERRSGDLLIFLRFAGNHELNGSTNIAVKEQRFSVHCSPSSDGYTVKQTLNLAEGKMIDSVQFYLPGPDGFISLIFGKTVQNLSPKKYDLKPKNNDKVVKLCEHDIGIMTMFYYIIVTESDFCH